MTKRRAFVAGSNGPSWETRLNYALDDSTRIAECLKTHCDFEVEQPLPGWRPFDAMNTIASLAAVGRPGDELIIYFSGHGSLFSGRLFLLWDDTPETIFDEALHARHIIEYMELSLATHKLFILDCCHAGAAVGFKGAVPPPILGEGGSQLVLCASSKLELAREFEDLKGSFLTHHMCSLLEQSSSSQLTLQDLVGALQQRANEHNALRPDERVPVPYLFGEQKTSLVLKRPKGPQPVEVVLLFPNEPDIGILHRTMEPYLLWGAKVLEVMPVDVSLPPEFGERIAALSHYVSVDEWPSDVSDGAKNQVARLSAEFLPDLERDLVRAVRIVAGAHALATHVDARERAERIIDVYLRAKAFAGLRVLLTYWLVGEPFPAWAHAYPHLDSVWNDRLIHGLTYVLDEDLEVPFWSDADYKIWGNRYRVFVPSLRAPKRSLSELEECHIFLIAPQIIEEERDAYVCMKHIAELIDMPVNNAVRSLVVRDETFIETQTHNSPTSDARIRTRAARRAAKLSVERLRALPEAEREAELIQLSASPLENEIIDAIFRLAPELRSIGAPPADRKLKPV